MIKRGSITVYLSLIFTIITALICTLIESGRYTVIEAKVNGITYMGLDSSFAEYASPLFKDYGLLFLWCSEGEFSTKLEDYISYNLDAKKGLLLENSDLYKMGIENIEVQDIEHATDNNGRIFANQVEKYMKYAAMENMFKEFISQMGLFNQSSSVKKFYDKISEYQDVFAKVEDTVGEIKDGIDKIQSITEKPDELLGELIGIANNIKLNMESGINYSSELNEFNQKYSLLKDTNNEFIKYITLIKNGTNSYITSTNNAKEAILSLDKELVNTKEIFDDEIYGLLNDELSNLKTKSTVDNNDYYGVMDNSNIVNDYAERFDMLNKFFVNNEEDLSENNINENIEGLNNISNYFLDFNLNNLKLNYEKEAVKKESNNLLDYIDHLKENGILGLVIENPDSISNENVNTNDLPSLNCSNVQSSSEDTTLFEVSEKKFLYSEYLLMHFGNYVNQIENTKMHYELEYIINGSDSDKENLSAVVNDLTLLREGCNLIYLLKDSTKRNEAYQLAIAMAGFTGMPILISITQFLILAAWAYAESILDVKNLLSGEKVPILKDKTQWNSSLSGITQLNNSTDSTKSITENGLNYEQYLRVLLLIKDNCMQYYRTMDLIQLNMCQRENPQFRLDQCINSTKVKISYSAKPLFITLPFVKNILNYKYGKYNYEIVQEYEY